MKTFLVAALGALIVAATAQATPRLEVSGQPRLGVARALALAYTQAPTDPVPAQISIRVPEAYRFPAASFAPGTRIGDDTISQGAVSATGQITVGDPSRFTTEAMACTGRAVHKAIWAAHVGSSRGVLAIPLYVDAQTITLCPDPAELGGLPTAIGLDIIGDLRGNPFLIGPTIPGTYLWRAFLSRPGVADTEIRSLVPTPERLTFAAAKTRAAVRIAGRLVAGGRGVGGARIVLELVSSSRHLTLVARSASNGRFAVRRHLPLGAWSIRARTFVPSQDVTATGCAATVAAGGCVSATRSGFGLAGTPAVLKIRV